MFIKLCLASLLNILLRKSQYKKNIPFNKAACFVLQRKLNEKRRGWFCARKGASFNATK